MNSIAVYYQNVRGLNTKIGDFSNAVASSNFDILAITETWLDVHIDSAELFTDAYNVFRSDRQYSRLGVSRGGGVLLAVGSAFKSSSLDLEDSPFRDLHSVDIVGARVLLGGGNLLVICVYVPPNFTIAQYESLFDALGSIRDIYCSDVLILGDFNLTNYAAERLLTSPSGGLKSLNNFLQLSNFQQCNLITNHNDRILDFVICSVECIVERAVDTLIDEDSHHPALVAIMPLSSPRLKRTEHGTHGSFSWNFRKGNFVLLYQLLSEVDWRTLYMFDDVDAACDSLYEQLVSLFDCTVPKTRFHRRTYPPWFNGAIIHNVGVKQKLWSRFKRSRDPDMLSLYKSHRSALKREIRGAHAAYINLLEENISSDPTNFWRYLSTRRGSSNTPSTLMVDGDCLTDPQSIANAFARYFRDSYVVSTEMSADSESLGPQGEHMLNISFFTVEEVTTALKKLKGKLTAGPDSVPSFLLKDCGSVFAKPLTFIFNLCLRKATFPSQWKLSKLCPLHKKGKTTEVSNYRPITIINNFGKVFEAALYTKIYGFFREQLVGCQHGFVAGRSTVTNLFCITQFIADSIDNRLQCDVVYTDFSKAFDRLDHGILLAKLDKIGFSPELVSFFKSYLYDRNQYVSFHGSRSVLIPVTSGVPQGSILGPLLFNIFINDITHSFDGHVHSLLYADDLKLYSRVRSLDDCICLQRNLERVALWCRNNRLYLNSDKCYVLSYGLSQQQILFNYSIDDSVLARPEKICDLGVVFDPKLSFSEHINTTVAKAFKMLGFIVRNCRHFVRNDTLVLLYNTYVRSHLEYASVIWEPYYDVHINSLERVQRRFLKYLSFKSSGVYPSIGFPHDLLLRQHNFESLSTRRQRVLLIFLHKVLSGKIDCLCIRQQLQLNTPRDASRHALFFYPPTPRTNKLKYSPLHRLCSSYDRVCHRFNIYDCTVATIRDLDLN